MANDIKRARDVKDVAELERREDETALDLDDTCEPADYTDDDPDGAYDERRNDRESSWSPDDEIEPSAAHPGASYGGGW